LRKKVAHLAVEIGKGCWKLQVEIEADRKRAKELACM